MFSSSFFGKWTRFHTWIREAGLEEVGHRENEEQAPHHRDGRAHFFGQVGTVEHEKQSARSHNQKHGEVKNSRLPGHDDPAVAVELILAREHFPFPLRVWLPSRHDHRGRGRRRGQGLRFFGAQAAAATAAAATAAAVLS